MRCFLLVTIILSAMVSSLAAQETKEDLEINGDRFLAGSTVIHNSEGVDDLFMAGETVRSEQAIAGSAHLAGRKIVSNGAIAGDAYVAGMEVSLNGSVAGDANVSGYNIEIGKVVGNVRAASRNIIFTGPVDGYALIAAARVKLDSVIKGDVTITAREISFSDGAKIEGRLTLYEEEVGQIEIPTQVISDNRISRKSISEWMEAKGRQAEDSWLDTMVEILMGAVIIGAVIAILAAVAPEKLGSVRSSILERPLRNLWIGILAESVVLGLTIVLIITVIGWLLVPLTVFVALISVFAGYALAAYVVGFKVLLVTRRSEPISIGSKALAAFAGSLIVSVVSLTPYIGGLLVIAVVIAGVGAIAVLLFRPKFFADA